MDLGARHHEMVEHAHVDQGQRLAQIARELDVGIARLGHARRVVMRQHDARRIAAQGRHHDFARIDAGVGQSAISSEVLRWAMALSAYTIRPLTVTIRELAFNTSISGRSLDASWIQQTPSELARR